MQDKLKLLILALVLFPVDILQAQEVEVTLVCEGQTLQFIPEGNNWGEPIWEYSQDSLQWEILDLPDNHLYEIQPEQTGYYRLNVYDSECDSSYVSRYHFIQVNEDPEIQISIHSWFTDFTIPELVDPFLWVSGDSLMTNLTFFINDEPFPSEFPGRTIPNPNQNFEVYASAVHNPSGCTVYSDTLEYSVIVQTVQENGIFNLTGNFTLNDISVSSSIDTVPLNGETDFLIDYSEILGIEHFAAIRTDIEDQIAIVGLLISPIDEISIVIDITSTASALIMSHPDLSAEIWTDYTEVQNLIIETESFPELEVKVQESLDEFGYIDLFDTELMGLVIEVVDQVVVQLDNLEGGGFRSELDYPILSANPSGILEFSLTHSEVIYVARMYHGISPLGDPIVLAGNNENFFLPQTAIFMNTLSNSPCFDIPALLAGISGPFQDYIRANNFLNVSDIATDPAHLGFETRLVLGTSDGTSAEEELAKFFNELSLSLDIFQMLPFPNSTSAEGAAECTISQIIEDIEEDGEVTFEDLFCDYFSESTSPIGIIVSAICAYNSSFEVSQNFDEYYYIFHSDVYYKNTKLAANLTDHVSLNSNSEDSFSAIPGGIAINTESYRPVFQFVTTNVAYPSWDPLNSEEDSPITISTDQGEFEFSDLITVTSSSIGTAEIGIEGFEPSTELQNHPVQGNYTILDWRLAYDIQPGETSETELQFSIEDELITNLDGLNPSGILSFSADVLDLEANPIAEFSVSDNTVTPGTSILFQDESIGNPTEWLWDFGDGETSIDSEPEHIYELPGLYTVSLTVWNESGSDTEVKEGYLSVTNQNSEYPEGTVHCIPGGAEIMEVINPLTGNIWMDRNLGASQVATSAYDELAFGDLYQWGRFSDGHQCRESNTTETPASSIIPQHSEFIISDEGWTTVEEYNLWQGGDGLNNPCPQGFKVPSIAEFNSEIQTWNDNTIGEAYLSPLKLSATGIRLGDGSINSLEVGYYATSTFLPQFYNSRRAVIFNSSGGPTFIGQGYPHSTAVAVRCIKVDCLELNSSFQAPCDDGNPNTITDYISHDCECIGDTLYSNETVHCTNEITSVEEVVNPVTGRIWMDRNLGALYPPLNSADADSYTYGDLYQWGRFSDGHQCKPHFEDFESTETLSEDIQPNHGYFISNTTYPFNWLNSENNSLWQEVDGLNNPCPDSFRVPTIAEWNEEINTWMSEDIQGARNSILKLTLGGYRYDTGSIIGLHGTGRYWSSTIDGIYAKYVDIFSDDLTIADGRRVQARSIRCIKD